MMKKSFLCLFIEMAEPPSEHFNIVGPQLTSVGTFFKGKQSMGK
jgi:hypothetical protein